MLAGKRPAIFSHQVGNLNGDQCDLLAVGLGGDFHQWTNVQTANAGMRVVGRRGSMAGYNCLEIPHKAKQFAWINRGVLHKSQGLSIAGNIV